MSLLILLAATLSGAAALVAETVWFRGLGRGVGTSAEALAVVTAGFLGGLGVGAAIASRLAPRSRFPFRAAAICECAAGVFVFLSPFGIGIVPDAHLWLLERLGGLEPGRSSWPAALVAVPLLVLPCAFLGATLPFLVRGRVASLGNAGRWGGWLYGANTLGAGIGVAAAAFALLPGFGETGSLRIAAGGNVLAAILILLAEKPLRGEGAGTAQGDQPVAPTAEIAAGTTDGDRARARREPEPASAPLPAPSPGFTGSKATAEIAGIALFVSGTMALGGEVAWFRLLEPITGIHVYGFAFLLVPVLLGTALGGAFGGFVADRVRRPDLLLSTVLGVGALLTALSVLAAGAVPWFVLRFAKTTGRSVDMEALRVIGATLCVLPPLFAFAIAYPLAIRARAASAAGAAAASGSVYAWNTAGNVAGSLLAGFVLVPAMGGARTLATLAGLGLLAAAALRLSAPRPRSPLGALPFLVPVAALAWPGAFAAIGGAGPSLPEIVALERWTPSHGRVHTFAEMRAYAEVVGGTYPTSPRNPGGPPILPRDGAVSSVGLLDEPSAIRLRQGGLAEARFVRGDPDAGSESEVALSLLPWLLHAADPAPTRGLVIGHGAGWTPEALLATDLGTVDVAELEPAVLDVVERYRGPLAVRSDPKARLHITDGRLLLRRAAKKGGAYDVIVSQPSHPWVPGAGHLFTADAYRLARAALRPGGVFSQWLNLFDMDRDLFQTAIASWREAFPDSWMFLYNKEVILVGFTATPRIDTARWERAFRDRRLAALASAAGVQGPEGLFKAWTADGTGLGRLVGRDARPATDDDPRLELGLAMARMLGRERVGDILNDIHKAFPPDVRAVIPDAGARTRWVIQAVRRLVDDRRSEDARRWDERVPYDGGAEGQRARAYEARANGETQRAEDLLRAAVKSAPDDASAAEDLLSLLVEQGRFEDAAKDGAALADRFPENGKVLAWFARGLVSGGDMDRAEKAFGRALEARKPKAPAGTAHELARLLLTLAKPRREEAHTILVEDTATLSDRDSTKALRDLEIDVGTQEQVRRYETILSDLDAKYGVERLRAGRGNLLSDDPTSPFGDVAEATSLLPNDPYAWRIRGWLELRKGAPIAAAESFRKAIAASKEPAAERARAEALLRMFDADVSALDEPSSEVGR